MGFGKIMNPHVNMQTTGSYNNWYPLLYSPPSSNTDGLVWYRATTERNNSIILRLYWDAGNHPLCTCNHWCNWGADNPTYCTTVPPQLWVFYIVTFLVVSRKRVLVFMLSMNFKHNKWTRSTSTDGATKHSTECYHHSGLHWTQRHVTGASPGRSFSCFHVGSLWSLMVP